MSGYEPDMSWAKCNCPWNPDSHAQDCPIYARNYIDTLRTANQRLEGEVAMLREALIAASKADSKAELGLIVDAALRGNGGE